jgi:hypothetical protein
VTPRALKGGASRSERLASAVVGRTRTVFVLAVLLGVAALVAVGQPRVLTADGPSPVALDPQRAALDEVVRRANAGDAEAQAFVRQLDQWLRAHGLSSDAISFEAVNDSRDTGLVEVRGEGLTPLWVDVYADADLSTSEDLSAYVAARRATLVSLASSRAEHRGRLSFTGFVPIDRLCELVTSAGGSVKEAMIDIWLDGKWWTRVGSSNEALWNQPCDDVTSAIVAKLAETHGADELGTRASEARLTVYGATVVIPNSAIPGILAADDVLVFDPEADLLAYWSGKAAQVRLAAPIDAFGAWVNLRVEEGEITNPFVPSGAGGK